MSSGDLREPMVATGKGQDFQHKAMQPQRPAAPPIYFFRVLAISLAIAIYVVAVGFPFVFEDLPHILQNPRVHSWSYFPHYFTESLWSHLGAAPNSYYRPLFLTWLLCCFKLFGADAIGWHVVGLFLHAGVTYLVYRLAMRSLKDRLAAGFAAVIFALHPIHVESVAWISGQNETLFAGYFLAAILCYLHWKEGGARSWRTASLVCFALGLLMEETAIVLPVMVLLYAWSEEVGNRPLERTRTALLEAVPYLAVAAVYLCVHAFATRNAVLVKANWASPASIVLTLPSVLWFYVEKLLYPWPMAAYYPLTFIARVQMWNFWRPLCALLLTAGVLWVWAKRDRRAALACGWIFVPLLAPVLAIVRFAPNDLVHDRYLYVPSIGISMLAALALRKLPAGEGRVLGIPAFQLGVLALVGFVMGVATVKQTKYWSSDLALYSRAVEVAPHNALALSQLASQLSRLGENEQAVSYLERAVEANPHNYRSLLLLGVAETNLGNYDRAIPPLLRARMLHPNGGMADFVLGRAELGANRLSDAELSLRRAIELVPEKPRQHYLLGLALERQGRLQEARQEFLDETKIAPSAEAQSKLEEIDSRLSRSAPTRR